jgi:hypothetical protein
MHLRSEPDRPTCALRFSWAFHSRFTRTAIRRKFGPTEPDQPYRLWLLFLFLFIPSALKPPSCHLSFYHDETVTKSQTTHHQPLTAVIVTLQSEI